MNARADLLLVTVTKVESKAVLAAFGKVTGEKAKPQSMDGLVFFDLGAVNGARVFLVQSEMGAGGLNASLQTVQKGIDALSPAAVLMVGIAFGVNEQKQAVGDILVAKQLRPYELQRIGTDKGGKEKLISRGDKAAASPWLLNHLVSADLDWEGAKVRFGVVLTGEKLVDNIDFRSQLLEFEPEAIGGEMEGAGLYVACHDKKVDWILVKGICDWADGHKHEDKDARQKLAVENAAGFVLYALQFARVNWEEHRRGAKVIRVEGEVLRAEAAAPMRLNTLPRQDLFFGRREEQKIIADALEPEARTWGALIDGPGGIGKTALAIKAAYEAPEDLFLCKVFLTAKVRELRPEGEAPLEDYQSTNFIGLITEIGESLGEKDLQKNSDRERAKVVHQILSGRRALLVIDNLETLLEEDRRRIFQFLERLPKDCKALVTSRRRSDVSAKLIRLDRLLEPDALNLLAELAKRLPLLEKTGTHERKALVESTGGNPLLLHWAVSQLGRPKSRCKTVQEACAFLRNAPAGNDPLEYVFGDVLGTLSPDETAVLCALSHFREPARLEWVASVGEMNELQAQAALEDLVDRSLVAGDTEARVFGLAPLLVDYLKKKRPGLVAKTGERLEKQALALVLENGHQNYDRFPLLEKEWALVRAAIPGFLRGENMRLQKICMALKKFLNFYGRWDEWQKLCLEAEAKAVAIQDGQNAGWRANDVAFVHHLKGEADGVLDCAKRAKNHWINGGLIEEAAILRLQMMSYRLQKKLPEAIQLAQKVLSLFQMQNPESRFVVAVLSDLAGIQRTSGLFEDAERNYFEALRIAEQINDREAIAMVTGHLAELALSRKDWPTAEDRARKALPLSRAVGRQEAIGRNSHRLAKALLEQGRAAEALPYSQQAVEIFKRLDKRDDLEEAQALLLRCTSTT